MTKKAPSKKRPIVTVSLTPPLVRYLEEKVESGGYTSMSEAIRESLRLLQQREQAEAMNASSSQDRDGAA